MVGKVVVVVVNGWNVKIFDGVVYITVQVSDQRGSTLP